MMDILERLAGSSPNESSPELQCRCFDAAEEISRLRVQRDELLAAAKNLRDVKGRHHSEQAFKALMEVIDKHNPQQPQGVTA